MKTIQTACPSTTAASSTARNWLNRIALAAILLAGPSCAAKLNQTLSKLPQTPEYSKPLSAYSVDQVVSVAKSYYPKVEKTPAQIFVFDGNRVAYPITYTINENGQSTTTRSDYSKVISLGHDGSRLTGQSGGMETW